MHLYSGKESAHNSGEEQETFIIFQGLQRVKQRLGTYVCLNACFPYLSSYPVSDLWDFWIPSTGNVLSCLTFHNFPTSSWSFIIFNLDLCSSIFVPSFRLVLISHHLIDWNYKIIKTSDSINSPWWLTTNSNKNK